MLRLKLAVKEAMDEETKHNQDRSAAGSHQHKFNLLHPGKGSSPVNTGRTAPHCQHGSSCEDIEECERLAHCHKGASLDDKDTSKSRSSSHPLHHCATAIEGVVISGDMDCVQADHAVMETALINDETYIIQQEETSVTHMQDGFVVLSMMQGHGLQETSDQLPRKTLPTTSKRMVENPKSKILDT